MTNAAVSRLRIPEASLLTGAASSSAKMLNHEWSPRQNMAAPSYERLEPVAVAFTFRMPWGTDFTTVVPQQSEPFEMRPEPFDYNRIMWGIWRG
jgi:hypothetical protein